VPEAELSLALLGSPAVRRDGVPATFDTRKAIALLAVLAVSGREQSRERLAALLWPEADDVRARGSLRRTLSVTSAIMADGMDVTRTTIALRPDRVSVDVTDFQALAARPDRASLDRAARLYRDDLLAGFSLRDCAEFDDWQAAEAGRLRQQLGGVLERLADACAAAGEPDLALGHARRWLSIDPLHEPANQAVIRLLGLTGQRSAALRQYRDLVRILDRELAVRPLPETTRLHDEVRAGRMQPARTSARAPVAPRPGPAAPASPAPSDSAAWPLVGRDAELRLLEAAQNAVTGGGAAGGVAPGGRVVAVVGEAGAGKSRLVAEFRNSAAGAGRTIMSARCHDGEAGLEFALATDLLRSALAARPGLPARVAPHDAAMAARLLPELAADREPGERRWHERPLSGPADLARLYSAVAATLLAAAGPGGVVIAEDLHWADPRSADVLCYLTRRLENWPLLLILSWRPGHGEATRGLEVALADAAEAGSAARCKLRPLRLDEVAELLKAAGVPRADPARMMRHTRGMPLLVREYAEALRSSGNEEDWQPPDSVRALLGRRLSAASEQAAQVLTAAAVLGGGCDPELLRAVSGRGTAEVVAAIDEAVDRFLLVETPPATPGGDSGAPRYDFPYEPLRVVAYQSATLARRRLLHGRAADALADRYAGHESASSAAVIAGHLQRAGREHEAAPWWWRAAARARVLYSHAEALSHLRQAEALGYPAADVAAALGDVLTVLGRYPEALGEYETAAASAGDDAARLAAIEHKLAEVHHRLGEWRIAETHLAAAADLLGPDDLSGLARVGADRAVLAYRLGDTRNAVRLGEEARQAAVAAGDAAAIAQVLNVLGMLAARAGDRQAAQAMLRDSIGHARSIEDHGAAVASLNNLARLLADSGSLGDALSLARQALALGSELGDQHRVAALHTNLADLLHAAGLHDEAMVHLKEAARRFAAVDAGGSAKPEIWTLVEW